MDDSEKIPEVVPPSTPEDGSIVKIVRTKNGGTREALVGKDGKFLKKKPDRREVNEDQARTIIRRELRTNDSWVKIVKAQIRLAQNVDAPDFAGASTKAAEWLALRTWGKPTISDSDKASREHEGIKTIIITQSPVSPDAIDHTKFERPTKPSWVNAEVVSTNEPPNT